MVIPCPKETVSNLHLFHLNFIGLPTSSNCKSGLLRICDLSINFLNFSLPIFLAINRVPMFEDLIKISSTDKSFGNSLISEILWLEQFIDLGIFGIIVCGLTILLSKANATVKVLNIEPSSYTPFVILLIYFIPI